MKIKKLLALSMLGLGAVGVASCGSETPAPVEPTPDQPAGITQEEVDQQIAEKILEYAKADAKKDLGSYVTNAIAVASVTDDGSVAIAKTEGESAIDAATTKEAVETAYEAAIKAVNEKIKAIQAAAGVSEAEALETARTNALEEIKTTSENGFYLNTKDDGTIAGLVAIANSAIAKITDAEQVAVLLTEAKEALQKGFDTILENSYIAISTIDEYLAMESGKNYKLVNDIDFAERTDLKASALTYSGIFDGKGYSIKNYAISAANTQNKSGVLFREMLTGSVVKNVRFANCSFVQQLEGAAIVTGAATDATFSNIEFNGCVVDITNAGVKSKSYAGLLIGRTTKGNLTVDQITVKGNSSVSSEYGGGLVGDARNLTNGSSVVKFTNLDIDLNMHITGNTGGLLIGRTDKKDAKFIVENARINANITGSTSKAGALLAGDQVYSDYTVKNVVVSGNFASTVTSDIVVGQNNGPTSYENVYVITDKTDAKNASGIATGITDAEVTSGFLFDTLKFSTDAWVTESDGSVKLKGASSNVIDIADQLDKIDVYVTRAKTYYYFAEAFTADNIVVIGTYTNAFGNKIQAELSTEANEKLGKYTVDSTAYNGTVAGTYAITVTAEKTYTPTATETDPAPVATTWTQAGSYDVTVNELSQVNVYADNAKVILEKGSAFSSEGLVVKGVYSNAEGTADDVESVMAADKYTVDSSAVDMATPGVYTVTVKATENAKEFSATYQVQVVDKVAVDQAAAKFTVNVDGTQATTIDTVANTATFKTVKEAIQYLEMLALPETMEKEIVIAGGTYKEKLTFNMVNVTLKGSTDAANPTILSYGAANGHEMIDGTGTYGTDKSASVLVYGKSFSASNVVFENSFDYFNDKSAGSGTQALAIGVYADEATFYKCSFLGYQDTIQTKNGRQYFVDCYVEGCVDYIFGVNSTTFFKNCEIKSLYRGKATNNGYVVAPKTDVAYTYGYYFDGCNFTSEDTVADGSMSVARPWGADATCVIINSTFSKAFSMAPYEGGKDDYRYDDMSGNSPVNAHFYEYNNQYYNVLDQLMPVAGEIAGMTYYTAEQAAKVNSTDLFAAGTGTNVTFEAWNAEADLTALKGE